MAFINEKLTQEQIDNFEKMNIIGPRNITLKPRRQTIDRTRNMCLIYYGVTSRDDPNENIFFIERNQKQYFIKLCFYSKSIGPRQAEITWNGFELLSGTDIPLDLEAFKDDIKAALKVYGILGTPDQYFQLDDNSAYHFDF